MYVVIGGGGKVGYYLGRELLEAGHELLIIEQNARKCEEMADELGDVVLRGDACEVTVLDRAGLARADLYIAVTGDDEDNLVSCQVAKHRFGVPRTIARINNPKNEDIFRALGIDSTVSSTAAVLAQIEHRIPTHPLIPLLALKGGGLEIVELQVAEGAAVVGRKLTDVRLPLQTIVSLVVRGEGDLQVPNADTVLRAGDELVAVTLRENEETLRLIFTSPAPAPA